MNTKLIVFLLFFIVCFASFPEKTFSKDDNAIKIHLSWDRYYELHPKNEKYANNNLEPLHKVAYKCKRDSSGTRYSEFADGAYGDIDGIVEKHLSFSEIEKNLEFDLPHSAYDHRAWWSNPSSPSDHPHAQSWLEAGWIVDTVNLKDKRVCFRRTGPRPSFTNRRKAIDEKNIGMTQNIKGMQFLLDFGFEEAGEWFLEDDSLQIRLKRHKNERNILYAFVAQGKIQYIGKSNQTLLGRMNGYKNPGPTQSTNINNNARIKELLHANITVKILVFVPKEAVIYREVPVNIAAGVEEILITKIRPPWNNRL